MDFVVDWMQEHCHLQVLPNDLRCDNGVLASILKYLEQFRSIAGKQPLVQQ